jgi:type I restriction-modification system DNA methylase subunit
LALKKSELYSSLWSSCDELRGGMDASQYKDYVLVLLFIKYISDKYAGQPFAPIAIPKGASFKDMVALKGKSDIGDQINKKSSSRHWQMPTSCPTCRTSMTRPSWAAARRWWTGSPT